MLHKTINILSYNIHKGFSARNRKFVLPGICQALHALNAEVVFLQEVQGKHRIRHLKKFKHTDSPQTELIANEKWPYFLYGKNAIYGPAHHGNSLLSVFPFRTAENINVAFAQRASRSLLHAVINFHSIIDIHVICIHLGLFRMERTLQLTTLSERIRQHIPPHAPLIIAGDFNDWRRRAVNHLEEDLYMQEVYKVLHGRHAKTYPASRPTFEVDRIYYRGLKLIGGQILKTAHWKKLSDHLPLAAQFAII